MGRLDDAGQDGMELLREIRTVYDDYAGNCSPLCGSVTQACWIERGAAG